ncbi:FAD:protein FMN transferase [Nocardioides sp.]|uniref:FAD:protein FMN transferase n=1 Tax=Nocardioides sp. TaxID=35761 RepID=UPI0035658745
MAVSRFDAIGTYVVVATQDPAELRLATSLAREILVDVDETCSRFRPDSDLSVVNEHPGVWVRVNPLLVAAVATACHVAEWTEGIVHPLLGRDLITLGYDRDLSELAPVDQRQPTGGRHSLISEPVRFGPGLESWREIGLRGDAVRIPAETALDLGSSGKAWAADLIVTALSEELTDSAAVSLGGDVAVSGDQPWPVEVSTQPNGRPTAQVWLHGGGLATSSTRVRRWKHGGRVRHHVLDPRTGLPALETWTTATATGPSCVAANAASTAAVVLGSQAPRWLTQAGVNARLEATDGSVCRIGGWPAADAPTSEAEAVSA